MRIGLFSVKFCLVFKTNINWEFCQVHFLSWYCFFFFFPITSVLPAAFGKHNISVKVLGSISKKILIKTLRTEACEKCVVTGSLPKVIYFYEKLECAHLHPLPWGHRPLLGEGKDVSRGFDTERKLSPLNFSSLCPILKLLLFLSPLSCHSCCAGRKHRDFPNPEPPGKFPVRSMQPLPGTFLPLRAQDYCGIDWTRNSWRKIKPPKDTII